MDLSLLVSLLSNSIVLPCALAAVLPLAFVPRRFEEGLRKRDVGVGAKPHGFQLPVGLKARLRLGAGAFLLTEQGRIVQMGELFVPSVATRRLVTFASRGCCTVGWGWYLQASILGCLSPFSCDAHVQVTDDKFHGNPWNDEGRQPQHGRGVVAEHMAETSA